jgi:hypothetical protein
MQTFSFKPYFYYTYRITNIKDNKHYYGSKYSQQTATKLPKSQLGIKYFSSSSDKDFIRDQKENPHLYKYKVIKIFNTPKDAIAHEIKLHAKFDVRNNPSFYNKTNQTSTGYMLSKESLVKGIQTKNNNIDENGLNSHQRIGKKSSKTKNTYLWQTTTKLEMIKNLRDSSLNNIDENGLNSHQRSGANSVKTKNRDIDENGLNGHQRAGLVARDTKNKINESTGKTIYQTSTEKMLKTMSTDEWKNTTGKSLCEFRKNYMNSKETNCRFDSKWINNGVSEKFIPREELVPDGFVDGRLLQGHKYNNGLNEISIKDGEKIPDGFVKGGLPQKVVKCPYCEKVGGISSMKKWHFERCKFKI